MRSTASWMDDSGGRMPNIGKLSPVRIKDVWPDEAKRPRE